MLLKLSMHVWQSKLPVLQMQEKVPEGYTSDDIKKFVTEAREVVDSYLSADQTSMVPNYADLTELEKNILQQADLADLMKKYPFRCARKTERRFNDEKKMISAVLAAVMTVGMITGCGSSQTTTENKADKADKLESQTDLSSTDYDFEKRICIWRF